MGPTENLVQAWRQRIQALVHCSGRRPLHLGCITLVAVEAPAWSSLALLWKVMRWGGVGEAVDVQAGVPDGRAGAALFSAPRGCRQLQLLGLAACLQLLEGCPGRKLTPSSALTPFL